MDHSVNDRRWFLVCIFPLSGYLDKDNLKTNVVGSNECMLYVSGVGCILIGSVATEFANCK